MKTKNYKLQVLLLEFIHSYNTISDENLQTYAEELDKLLKNYDFKIQEMVRKGEL